jgi:hypothetical protein
MMGDAMDFYALNVSNAIDTLAGAFVLWCSAAATGSRIGV